MEVNSLLSHIHTHTHTPFLSLSCWMAALGGSMMTTPSETWPAEAHSSGGAGRRARVTGCCAHVFIGYKEPILGFFLRVGL